MTERTDIEIIVLQYNSLETLAYTVEGIKQNTENYKLTIIDNASTDGSIEWLKTKKLNTVFNSQNLLFTNAYMNYLRTAKLGKYFVIMNNDCIPEKGWLEEMYNFMEANPDCGIVAPMLTDVSGTQVQNMGGGADFCSHKGGTREQWKQPEKNWWTTFACVMIRTEAFKKVGGMDRQYLFYCSDSDICLKMNLANYTVYNIPSAVVRHFHSRSTQIEGESGSTKIIEQGHKDQMLFNARWERHGISIGRNNFPVQEYSYNALRS